MTPNAFAKAVLELTSSTEVDERSDLLVFQSALANASSRRVWANLLVTPPAFLTGIYITNAESDSPFTPDASPIEGERFRITIQKTETEGQLRLFFSASLNSVKARLERAHCIQIAEMDPDETFSTQFARYQPWTLDDAPPFAPLEPLVDPRKFVKDFTSERLVPNDVRHWLLRASPVRAGAAFETWKRFATVRLIAALSDQVSCHEKDIVFNFSGPPTQAITLSNSDFVTLADGIQAASNWVFVDGNDADTRHVLFANEWARAYRAQELNRLAERSLESAQAAYSAYVKAGSRETLKALADLRKAVAEETQKISQKAQELASGLWKDLPVAAAPFVLKILSDSAKISNNIVASGLAFAAAIFLIFSYSIQVYINGRFFKHQDSSRVVWRQVLNTVLSRDELDQYSETPITEGQKDYRRVRNAVGLVYIALVVVLIVFGVIDLSAGSAATTTQTPNIPPISKQPPSVKN